MAQDRHTQGNLLTSFSRLQAESSYHSSCYWLKSSGQLFVKVETIMRANLNVKARLNFTQSVHCYFLNPLKEP